jgi:hypothetical protein
MVLLVVEDWWEARAGVLEEEDRLRYRLLLLHQRRRHRDVSCFCHVRLDSKKKKTKKPMRPSSLCCLYCSVYE